MSECKDCKYAVWDYEEYYGSFGGGKHCFVSDCELDCDNEDGNCEEFDEYLPPLPDGF